MSSTLKLTPAPNPPASLPLAPDHEPPPEKVAAGAGTAITSLDALRKRLAEAPVNRARRLGEALVDSGLVDAQAVAHALERQAGTQPHRLIGQLLVDSELLSPSQLAAMLAEWLGVPTVDPRFITPEPDALRRLPRSVALRETLLPLMVRGDTLVVAMPNPWDKSLLDELRFICELRIVPAIAVAGTLAPMVARAYAMSPMAAQAAAAAADTNDQDDGSENTAFANRDVHELAAATRRRTQHCDRFVAFGPVDVAEMQRRRPEH